MFKINSALLISGNSLDNFINKKILEKYGVLNIVTFESTVQALLHLQKKRSGYDLILVDIYIPIINGFEFIDKLQDQQLYKNQSKLCILSASIDPLDKEKAKERHVEFIEKPLTIAKINEIECS